MDFPDINLAAGPVEISPRVSMAMARPVLYHYDPSFIELYKRIDEKLKKAFLTKHDIIIQQGEAILGLEAAAHSCIAPGDKCLNLVTGVFGKWFEDFIIAAGGTVIELKKEYNESITEEDVREAFRKNPDIAVMSVVHSETPSGTVNPVDKLCPIVKEHGAITIVDTVSGVFGSELRPDDWGIDVCITGPQKCLGAAPGLSIACISPDAWAKMEKSSAPANSYMSFTDWKSKWIENSAFPYTPSVSLLYGLDEALSMLLEEGIESVWERHALSARMCRAGIKGMGLNLWPASEDIAADCCTAFKTPEGVDSKAFRDTLREKWKLMIVTGYGELAPHVLRIGHLGHTAKPLYVLSALALVGKALLDSGVSVDVGKGIDSALAEL